MAYLQRVVSIEKSAAGTQTVGFGIFDQTKKDGKREIGVNVHWSEFVTVAVDHPDNCPGNYREVMNAGTTFAREYESNDNHTAEYAREGQEIRLSTPAGTYYRAMVGAARNGYAHGSAVASAVFTTREAREAWIAKKVQAARKRYQRLQAAGKLCGQ